MKQKIIVHIIWGVLLAFVSLPAWAQRKQAKSLVYVDKHGVLRYTAGNEEVAFFGVNYTVPFAHGYRMHKKLGVDLKKAIDADVYHFARLGLNAFRVHVWDTEITDVSGNLLKNEHLDLFDYLVQKLKERDIKIVVTPIAFWGNGYPEKDEATGSFSAVFGKQRALVNDTAIRAQENYLRQFFRHVNPYTGLTYTADPDIIATEINNEPNHSGPPAGVKEYVNRMAAAIRSSGWKKPVFYNISESPFYAASVADAAIDGVTFQWYPTGLVANRTLEGNLLPNVDQYRIPFDTIPAFRNKARMVYEFDAGDVLQPVMYPAMARSFRTAGFQWATQFAYDPMHTAFFNTEYQTHYLNLAYTPEKAISLLIAGKVFRSMPRLKSYGAYPADTSFGPARLSYRQQLSEWNTATEFYYTGNTITRPVDQKQLRHIAGTGSSPVIAYGGTGAYFLDQLEEGVWRLELMPDLVPLRDPFEKASPSKELRRVQWSSHVMYAHIPDLGEAFTVSAVNRDDSAHLKVSGRGFKVGPGVYLLCAGGKDAARFRQWPVNGVMKVGEFAAPRPEASSVFLQHTPYKEITAEQPVQIKAVIAGIDSAARIWIEGSLRGGQWFKMNMEQQSADSYIAVLPVSLLQHGMLNYKIVVQQGGIFTTFPGNTPGDPYAWDNIHEKTWQTYVAAGSSIISLINPADDKDLVCLPSYTQGMFTAADRPGQLAVRLGINEKDTVAAVSRAVANDIAGRIKELPSFNTLVLRARTKDVVSATVRVALITTDGAAYETNITIDSIYRDIEIPLSQLSPGPMLLLPRPYPGFMPLWFTAPGAAAPDLRQLDKAEISLALKTGVNLYPCVAEVESLWLKIK